MQEQKTKEALVVSSVHTHGPQFVCGLILGVISLLGASFLAGRKYNDMRQFRALRSWMPEQASYMDLQLRMNSTDVNTMHHDLIFTPRDVQEDLSGKGSAGSSTEGSIFVEELLVHPVLLVHPDPKNVAIFSASSKSESLISQVKKHTTVKKIFVFADQQAACQARETESITGNEEMDLGIDIFWIDSFQKFDSTYPGETFNVAIVDANPSSPPPSFWHDHLSLLDGILISHLDSWLPSLKFNQTLEMVEPSLFVHATDFTSPDGESFVVAYSNHTLRARWHLTEAHMSLLIRERMTPNENDEPPLVFFDSTTLSTIEFPSKQTEVEFCKLYDCPELHGHDPEIPNTPNSLLTVAPSGIGENVGRGVFATVDIAAGSNIGLESSAHAVHATAQNSHIMTTMVQNEIYENNAEVLEYYFDGYGFLDEPFGMPRHTVDSGLLTFVNHGCNGTNNLGENATEFNEQTVDPMNIPAMYSNLDDEIPKYDPVKERDWNKDAVTTVPYKQVAAGEELLDNYLSFGGDTYWKENVDTLRQQCAGVAVGEVEIYQTMKKESHHDMSSPETKSEDRK